MRGDSSRSPERADGLILTQGPRSSQGQALPWHRPQGIALSHLHPPSSRVQACSACCSQNACPHPEPVSCCLPCIIPSHVSSCPRCSDLIPPIAFWGKAERKGSRQLSNKFPQCVVSPPHQHLSLHPAFKSWKNRKSSPNQEKSPRGAVLALGSEGRHASHLACQPGRVLPASESLLQPSSLVDLTLNSRQH